VEWSFEWWAVIGGVSGELDSGFEGLDGVVGWGVVVGESAAGFGGDESVTLAWLSNGDCRDGERNWLWVIRHGAAGVEFV